MENEYSKYLSGLSDTELKNRVSEALETIFQYGQIDGDHHKAWVIDQVVRKLLGSDYDAFLYEYENDADTGEQYAWEGGIAP